MFEMQLESFPIRKAVLLKGLASILAFAGAGCALFGDDNVWVYFDNAGQKPMIVIVDENQEATIDPGQFTVIKIPPGDHHVKVQCGEEILFDGVKKLKKSEQVGVGRRYFFNPGNHHRYMVYTVKYGSSPFEGMVDSALVEASGDRRNAIRLAFQKLAGEVKLMPPDSWFEVPVGAYVLTDAPKMVMTRGYSERRTVLTRLNAKDYEFLKRALDKDNPTEADFEKLEEAIDRAIDSEV